MSNRPASEEYAPYYERYVNLVGDGDILDVLQGLLETTSTFLSDIPESKGDYRYAPDKWSLKEVIGHINDNERIMSYRLLRIARGDQTPHAGYDQDALIKGANFHALTLTELIEDYIAVRRSTITLARGLKEEAYLRVGIANDTRISVRALAYILAGHELHHLHVIKERYLP
ncbi:DinB family protein [Cohnella abietis]|uniref:DinB-like domain-containing protein n=1 Tax=Cohnella abietis TaxID=2507935 RepID=A0A3T1D837_9BACL|nr:DinB family protein [Cohnella abietis]BBI34246.1 hypothetical protein KCTCHS21_36450 [Cohnella abietis]